METATEEVAIHDYKQQAIDGLREALDMLEANPELANAVYIPSSLTAYVYDKDRFDHLRRLIGPHTKQVTSWSAVAARQLNDEFRLEVSVSREEVCTKVKVGEKTVEKEVYPEDVQPLTVVETEDVYEWVCPDSWGK